MLSWHNVYVHDKELSATGNVAKSAQNCPKTISLENFEIPPKIEILMFFKKLKAYV
jgi:hypothetical protein